MGNKKEVKKEVKKDLLLAIVIADNIQKENSGIVTSMQWDRNNLGDEPYTTSPVKIHLSVCKLVPVIKSYLSRLSGSNSGTALRIFTHHIEHDGERVSGQITRSKDGNYWIDLDGDATYCTQRLALCKELMQAYVDMLFYNDAIVLSAMDQMRLATGTLRKFYTSAPQQLTDALPNSETFAHSVALELMIPYQVREEIALVDFEDEKEVEELAKRLFLTKKTLQDYLLKYFDATTSVYNMLNKKASE